MSLYFLRIRQTEPAPAVTGAEPAYPPPPVVRASENSPESPNAAAAGAAGHTRAATGPAQIVHVDLGKLFTEIEAGKMQVASAYEKVCGVIPLVWGAGGDMALDCTEEFAYFRVVKEESAKHLAVNIKLESSFGPRNMGAGPAGLGKMNLKNGEVSFIVAVPIQIGHVQTH